MLLVSRFSSVASEGVRGSIVAVSAEPMAPSAFTQVCPESSGHHGILGQGPRGPPDPKPVSEHPHQGQDSWSGPQGWNASWVQGKAPCLQGYPKKEGDKLLLGTPGLLGEMQAPIVSMPRGCGKPCPQEQPFRRTERFSCKQLREGIRWVSTVCPGLERIEKMKDPTGNWE